MVGKEIEFIKNGLICGKKKIYRDCYWINRNK